METNKTALITGASSGIGLAITRQLLKKQYTVIGLSRDFSKCNISDEHFIPVTIDFAMTDKLPDALTTLARQYTDVDSLICCAGKGHFGSLEEFSYPQIKQLMDLNFLSQAFVTRAFMPSLKKRGRGDIIYIGSEAALAGSRKGSIYCASKFALRGFAQALRDECSRNGIRVTMVNPGMVKTPFFDQLDFEHGADANNYIEPDDVANAVTMILQTRPETVFDEISLSPLKKVVQHKPK